MWFLVVVGILEILIGLPSPRSFMLAHLAQTYCRANIIEAIHWLTIWETNQTDPYHLTFDIEANAETRDNYREDPRLIFQSTAQPLRRESSPPLQKFWLKNTKFPCYIVVLQSFKKVGRAASRIHISSGPPLVLQNHTNPPLTRKVSIHLPW